MAKHVHLNPQGNTLDNLLEGFQLISFDWRYLYVNEAVVKQSRYPAKEDLLGFTMMEKYPGIENTQLFWALQRCMAERVPALLENEFKFPDGNSGWFELRIEPVPEGLFVLSLDISERKKAELERKKYTQDLEEMIFITSHKVRQPVSNILGLSALLDSASISLEELKNISGYMKQSAIKLDNFTKELTNFIEELKIRS
ncbi:MAG: PAS domain-containing protein [Sphingobacteriaceae bacterium]